jgi:hypothetical protein
LPIPQATTQPVYGNQGGIKPPVSSTPSLPASAVAGTVVGNPDPSKITNAVVGPNPVVQTVGQAPVSELSPGVGEGAGPGRQKGLKDYVDDVMGYIPFSGLAVVWRLANADSWSDAGHQLLDIVGMLPAVGEAADGANGLWYLGEGDKLNAGLSGAAMIPFAGWAASAAKTGKRAAKSLEEGAREAKQVAGDVPSADPNTVYRAPKRGNKDMEERGPDPANHPDVGRHLGTAYLGDSEGVAQQYAVQGIYEDGYWAYTMKPEFKDHFPADRYRTRHDYKSGEYQWIIPRGEIPHFNSLIAESNWINFYGGYKW